MQWVTDWFYCCSILNYKSSGLTLEIFSRKKADGTACYRNRIKEWHTKEVV